MLLPELTKIASHLPSSMKLRLRGLRPLYSMVIAFQARPVSIERYGRTLHWVPDELTSQAHLYGTYEPEMREAFEKLVEPGFVVYDVGAHAGYHALTCALLTGPRGQVIAFEPRQSNWKSIARQLEANPDLPVRLLPVALSNRDGMAMFDDSVGSSEGMICPNGRTRVETRSLDSLVTSGEIPPPHLIKIDVEGHEPEVLAGAQGVISTHRPIVIADYNVGDTVQAMRAALERHGYEVMPSELLIVAKPKSEFR